MSANQFVQITRREKFSQEEFYPMITARKIGKNADHDFVQTLGKIFEILDFKVNPQYYARKVAVGLAGSDVS